MKNILVTGSNGQLGNEIRLLVSAYPDFNIIFHDIDTLDITDAKQVLDLTKKHELHAIINCAAYTAVDKAEDDEKNALMVNAQAVKNLAELAKASDAIFIHVSTDYVFDGNQYIPYKESDSTSPVSVYGKTKLKGEENALAYTKSIVIRTAWLYSSFGNNFAKTMLKYGAERESLNVVYDQVGSPTYARDLAIAILDICHQTINKDEIPVGIYHYSNEGVCSWYDFTIDIMNYKKYSCKINPIESWQYPLPTPRPHYSVLNKSKIKETFHVNVPYWKDSLIDCLKAIEDSTNE